MTFKPVQYLLIILVSLFHLACSKNDPDTPPPNTNNTIGNLSDLSGQTWILYQYRIGQVALNYSVSDTLIFLDPTRYTFNNDTNSYSLYSVPASYKLNLNGTPWGNLSGNIFDYNLSSGEIPGLRFTETFTGTQSEYFLWLRRF